MLLILNMMKPFPESLDIWYVEPPQNKRKRRQKGKQVN